MRFNSLKVIVAAGIFTIPGMAFADEEAEQMMQEALPLMYHTCTSVIEEADGNEEYILEVVGKMTALSLYNRQVDIEAHAASDEDKAALRETFLAALKDGCAGDENALLGGVVDNAVKTTLGL
ncbi:MULTISPECIES: hypothetical protein [unclassified Ruegeria]|uniref:hypothetical protein n=1 Tax=unclassified Ruegeria TaxID=2625375 RepID=UPI0014895995|nr:MULTISPECIES: hypothetical protein [unclassified Ruegeria]NOD36773.1 hypothetical protein [Ruegeria sp. HKCCD7296]NOD47828.1 hypothetical protein [Ruegeria sp. HKCCD5849]NOD52812.1 hypothetical protein [Ruegeria sp. HKCCD5851]NOD68958.1 hypothetical protein [Ruegeria sp. HKCCD7303]NOE35345.1 hypothetical protein [Ruegeria sp. HKCCD7318]